MPANLFDRAVNTLKASKASICCLELIELLQSLGFEVRSGKAGHKVYVHDHLPDFLSSSFNCGHGRNPEIKISYIANVLRVLRTHEVAIKKYLGQKEAGERDEQ